MHPVIAALRERPAGARVALVVEGGGMRGSVSGGMVLGLHELGFTDAFDAAFGSSAGALNAMWFVSGRVRDGIPTWTDPRLVGELISRRRALRGGPVVDVHTLVERRYELLSPGLFDAVLASPTALHPIATDVASGEAVDLGPTITDPVSLRLALRASAALPLLAGGPVRVDGRRMLDAGLSAAIPFRAALAAGATHVLVLRSRREGETAQPPTGLGGALTERLLRRIDPAMATAFRTRAEREAEDEALLASGDDRILQVRPPAGAPVPARLERDIDVIRGGLEGGRRAVHDLLA